MTKRRFGHNMPRNWTPARHRRTQSSPLLRFTVQCAIICVFKYHAPLLQLRARPPSSCLNSCNFTPNWSWFYACLLIHSSQTELQRPLTAFQSSWRAILCPAYHHVGLFLSPSTHHALSHLRNVPSVLPSTWSALPLGCVHCLLPSLQVSVSATHPSALSLSCSPSHCAVDSFHGTFSCFSLYIF